MSITINIMYVLEDPFYNFLEIEETRGELQE